MKVIVGHGNMDLDCIGSLLLARRLFPDHVPVRSGLIHPAARNVFNLYKDRLGFLDPADLKGKPVERVVVVDTRARGKIEEYFRFFDPENCEFEVFDHHPSDGRDIPGAIIHESVFGANTTGLCLELRRRGLSVEPEDATIALTGLYADTGNFLHENVCLEDFEAASFLLSQGAALPLVKEFLVSLRDGGQLTLFHELINALDVRTIRGHRVHTCYIETKDETQGIGAVAEKAVEVENCALFFGFFFFTGKKKLLVIARNSLAHVRLNEILADFGGGGHARAAAATVKTDDGRGLAERILGYLDSVLVPAVTAGDLMTETVKTLSPEQTLLDASLALEEANHTGAPVLDERESVVGMLTLRDIMKGRKAGEMKAKVKQYMSKSVVSVQPETTVREIEEQLFSRSIGHLPVLRGGSLVGIVTRGDFLDHLRGERTRRERALEDLGLRTSSPS